MRLLEIGAFYTQKMLTRIIIVIVFTGFTSTAFSSDLVKANIGESTLDQRIHFKQLILTQALELTKEEYGTYEIEVHSYYMNAKRGFAELKTGRHINVYFALTQKRWEEEAIPIRIPVRRGLVSYRLMLTNKMNQKKIERITNVDYLKEMSVGLNDGWSTYTIMNDQSFKIFPVDDYNGMFGMLSANRFDYIPRGVNEVFGELEQQADSSSNLLIADNVALYIPSATYIFVSKQAPRLAKRLEAGLTKMVENGDLKDIFYRFYGESIVKAQLQNRKILRLENPFLPKETPLKNKDFWYDPKELFFNEKDTGFITESATQADR